MVVVDALSFLTLNALAWFTGFFSSNYGRPTVWIFGLHTLWCMIFGNALTNTIGAAPRDITFSVGWGLYFLNILIWAWAGANLRMVMRGTKFLDPTELRDLKESKGRYNVAVLVAFLIYFLLYAASFILFELRSIGAEPLGGLLALAAAVLFTMLFYWVVRRSNYYPEPRILLNELGYFLLGLVVYGVTYVICDALYVYGKFDAWYTQNWNAWLSVIIGGVALIIYPLILDRFLAPPAKAASAPSADAAETGTSQDAEPAAPPSLRGRFNDMAIRYIRLD